MLDTSRLARDIEHKYWNVIDVAEFIFNSCPAQHLQRPRTVHRLFVNVKNVLFGRRLLGHWSGPSCQAKLALEPLLNKLFAHVQLGAVDGKRKQVQHSQPQRVQVFFFAYIVQNLKIFKNQTKKQKNAVV
ncbi:hypothetical protein BpHYR1_013058 [Brachionus plicatilis]|uniref:Uncharacterized protein n=1 Tax=Brachionus plicatilis TaxID=10195 RepID=A0A3M7RUJ7_BRAPC|nr:hypothetical protein BpHYR1_013058 [Brachionus plicatilis]